MEELNNLSEIVSAFKYNFLIALRKNGHIEYLDFTSLNFP